MTRPTLMERALQLAGQGRPTEDIIKRLGQEGYENPRPHLQGRAIRELLLQARKSAAADNR